MKTKILSLLSLSVLALLMFAGMASAAIVLDPNTYTTSIAQEDSSSFNFNITVDYDATESNATFTTSSVSNLVSGTNTIVSANIVVGTLPSTLAAQATSSNIAVTISVPSATALGTYNGTITIDAERENDSDDDPDAQTIALSVTVTASTELNFCEYDDGVSTNLGELDVNIKDVKVVSGFGDDEEWLPFDEIEVEIEIENKGNYDVDDISIEWGIADEDMNEWVIEMDEEDEFNLKDDDEEKLTITFRIDDDDLDMDLDELNGGYRLYVRATGTIDDNDSPNDGEDTCASNYETVSIEIESDFVILNDIKLLETVQCGSEVQITADVWNIGDDDQDDVSVIVSNTELGINKVIKIGDIDAFDNEVLDTFVEIPEGVEEKTYSLKFTVYDDDHSIYENDYDEKESIFSVFLKVEGDCSVSSTALVSANLESGGEAGEALVFKSTIVNSGTKSATYTVNVASYAEWANSVSIDQSTFTLAVGASKEVLLTFDVKEDASGEKQFNIGVRSGNDVTTQPVQVEIEGTSSWFAGITGNALEDSNKYLWGIGILNVILIIFIIIVAIKVAKK